MAVHESYMLPSRLGPGALPSAKETRSATRFKKTTGLKTWVCRGLIVSYVLGESAEIFVSMTAKVGVEQKHTLVKHLHKSTLCLV